MADKQAFLALIADASETVGGFLTLTGGGALAASLSYVISLAIRAIDAAMSGYLLGKAYQLWWSVPQSAAEATRLAFAPLAEASLAADRDRAATGYAITLPGFHEGRGLPARDAPSSREKGDIKAPELPLHLDFRLSQVRADASDYISGLSRLSEAVRFGDRSAVERAAEELLSADGSLSDSLLVARQPIFAAADELLDDERFASAYLDFGRKAAAFDGEGAILYLYLLAWLAEPENADIQEKLLEQIGTVRDKAEGYIATLEAALPLVVDFSDEPSVVVARYALPESLSIGREASLSVEILNPAPDAAEGVTISFDAGRGARAVSESTKTLSVLGGTQRHTLEFRFVPLQESGLLTVSTSARNGSGTMRLIPFAALASIGGTPTASTPGRASGAIVPPPPLSPSPGNFPAAAVMFLMLVLMGGGALAYVLNLAAHRRATLALAVVRGDARPPYLPLGKREIRIGRGVQNDVVVGDPKVSRIHCRITREGDSLVLMDLGSANGTFVNGRRVTRHILRPGDVIRIGDVELILQQMAAQRF